MTDSQLLLIVVIAIYLSECLAWASKQVIVFQTHSGARWRWLQPGRLFGNDDAGLVVRYPLPPLGESFFTTVWPVSISADGVVSLVSYALAFARRSGQVEREVLFDGEFRDLHALDRDVHVNGRRLVTCASIPAAQWLISALRQLQSTPATQREAKRDQLLAEQLDTAAIRRRLAEYLKATRFMRMICILLWLHVFVVCPALIALRGIGDVWLSLLLMLVILWMAVVVSFRSAHRTLYGKAERRDRWKAMAILMLNPLMAIRAHDFLSRDLLMRYHPMAVACVLLDPKGFESFAREFLRDLRYPLQPIGLHASTVGCEIEREYRTWLLVRMTGFAAAQQVDVARLEAPDPPEDSSSQSYCPRCQTQYTMPTGVCDPCGRIPLERFPVA